MCNIKEIIYIKKMMPSVSEYFLLQIDESENKIKYIDDRDFDKEPMVKVVSKEVVIEFLDKLLRIIDSWKEEYIDNGIIDGTEWQLKIVYKSGYERNYCGKNAFPDNYEALDKIKREMIKKQWGVEEWTF